MTRTTMMMWLGVGTLSMPLATMRTREHSWVVHGKNDTRGESRNTMITLSGGSALIMKLSGMPLWQQGEGPLAV